MPSASPAPSSSRSSSYTLRTPPAVKVNYVHRLGVARKRSTDSFPPASSAKAVKRSRLDASEVIVIADDDSSDEAVVETPRRPQKPVVREEQVEVQDLGEYTVGAIIARSLFPGYGPDGVKEYQYLIRWAGYGPADDTWEMETSLRETVGHMIRNFDSKPRPWTILKSRSESKQRQYLIRFAPPGDTTPHAEEEWLTRWTMQTHGMADADKRIQSWLNSKGQDRKLFVKTPVAGVKRTALGMSGSSNTSTHAPSPKRTKTAYPTKSTPKAKAPAPLPILLEIHAIRNYQKKPNGKQKTQEFEFSYRPNGPDSAIQRDLWTRSRLHARYGVTRVNEVLAVYRSRVKAEEEEAAKEREAIRQAQQENEYEIERQRRIEENMAMMRELGLGMAT